MKERGITKEYFLSGGPFLLYYDACMGRLYLNEGDIYIDDFYNPNKYVCNIDKVEDDGFLYYGSFMGKNVEGKVFFKDCIPISHIVRNK